MTIVRTTTVDDAAAIAQALDVEPRLERSPADMHAAPATVVLVWMVQP
jgi:hypothetical protein